MSPEVRVLPDVQATEALGAELGAGLRAGDLVVLAGPLGAGKTALVRGLARALGVRGRVTSPTFVLARRHDGPVPLLHVDAYRLRENGLPAREALEDLDLDAALEAGVVAVEWGEGVVEDLAPSRVEVVLAHDGDRRRAVVTRVGERWRMTGAT